MSASFPESSFRTGSEAWRPEIGFFSSPTGLTEANDVDGNMFGRERAEQVFSVEIGLPPKEFCAKVKEWVDRFAVGSSEDTVDDFTILQVKVD